MSKISQDALYTNKHEWLRAIIAAMIALIVGFFSGKTIDMNDYLSEEEKEKTKLEEKIEKLEKDNDKLEKEKKDLENELNDSLAKSFPDGYYYPATGVYLLDNYEMKNNDDNNYELFDDSSVSMKGQIYNNGFSMAHRGQGVFYLKGKYKLLEFIVGPIDDYTTEDMCTIKVYADGQQMNSAINQNYETKCTKYAFDLRNCNELKIQWANCDYYSYGIADLKVYE